MNDQPSFFEDLKQIAIAYFEAKIKIVKISASEKIAAITAVLVSSVIITVLAFFLIFFLSISGGFFFGGLLNSYSLGFLVIFGIYLFIFLLLLIFRKKLLEKFIATKVVGILLKEDKK